MKLLSPELWSEKSVWGIVGANAFVLFGTLFLGWDAAFVLVLYWAENVIIGGYNILKVALVRCRRWTGHLGKLFLIPFFALHYGGFCGVHGAFILGLTAIKGPHTIHSVFPRESGGPLVFVQMFINVVRALLDRAGGDLAWPLAALVCSHGMSFVENYLLKREYQTTTPEKLMSAPYGRIVVLHVAIIAGGAPVMLLGSPVPLLVVLVVLKTMMDIQMHRKAHAKLRATQG